MSTTRPAAFSARAPLIRLMAFAIGMLLAAAVSAQDKQPLRIVTGFPPGGSVDILSRVVAEALRDDFSAVVVENKPGAAGRIALNQVKLAKPDGQTVIILPMGPMVLFPHTLKSWITTASRISLPFLSWPCPISLWWPAHRAVSIAFERC